jgi:DNA-binding transcriptional LysR family regulator
MDLVSLDIFRTVAEEGSVTGAARRLDRVQSNVTTRLRQLEADLGVALFSRDGRRMTLTHEGRVLLDYAHRLQSLVAEARAALMPGAERLRLGAMESTAASRLPGPLARFRAIRPDAVIDLVTGPTDRLVGDVVGHRLDCALVARPPIRLLADDPLPHPELTERTVVTEDLLLVAPAGAGENQPPAALAVLEPGCTYRRIAENLLVRPAAAEGRMVRVHQLNSYHAVMACVAAGTASGVMPRSVFTLLAPPEDLRVRSLGPVETVLVARRDYRSAGFETLAALLAEVA